MCAKEKVFLAHYAMKSWLHNDLVLEFGEMFYMVPFSSRGINCCHKWHSIGTFLEISDGELNAIAEHEHGDPQKCLMAMLGYGCIESTHQLVGLILLM